MIEGKTQEEAINIVALQTEKNTTELEEVKYNISEMDEEIKENTSDINEAKTYVIVQKDNIQENNDIIMTEEENLKKELEEIDTKLSDSSLSSLETKLLNLKKQSIEYKIANPNYKVCNEKLELIFKIRDLLDLTPEELRELKYADIDFNQCTEKAKSILLKMTERLSKLENIPENEFEIKQLTLKIEDFSSSYEKRISLVKDNLKDLEDKCFSK
jgi:uncharacterized phage infection (PIP) family protein YhgE